MGEQEHYIPVVLMAKVQLANLVLVAAKPIVIVVIVPRSLLIMCKRFLVVINSVER